MFCTDAQQPLFFLFSDIAPQLLYYSHLPAVIISLLLGFFVYFKNKGSLSAKLLLLVSILFSIWAIFDIIAWVHIDSRVIMFFWALMNLIEPLIFASILYFSYVFIKGKDSSIIWKIIVVLFLLPVIFLISSQLNLTGFDIPNCEAIQGNLIKYIYFLDILFSFWVIVFLLKSYVKAEKEFRKQIIYFSLGIILFLLAFSWANIIGNITVNWEVTQYGLFGMPIFMGFLAFMIVKYKAFDIKLIGAQALVYSLVILIGSQFFFITSNTNRILTGITLALAVGFGIFLIKSVKAEIQRKDELQYLTEKLAIANDELRKLDNAKSEFISIASHQLRTPLTAIKGYISLILEGNYGVVNEIILNPLNKIYASNERLIQLVEDLLNVSRIESGRMEFTFEKAGIEKIIRALYDTFSIISKGKGLYLNLNMPKEPLPEVEIDPGKTREVISNLIDNALKYTKRGGVTVKAEVLKNMNWSVKHAGGQDENLSGDVVRITISDTGIGVPDAELPYLFSKFSRGKDTSRLHVGGTGLGLYVGKNIIESQHGKIWVESEGLNKGSKFIVDLPVVQPKA